MKKVGLVGCGRISKRHIEAISATEGVEIAYVCDKIEERAKATAQQLNVPYTTDYRELNGKGLDVISVLTPSGLHPRHVCNIAELTDAPYIVCEKPLSLTVREAFENTFAHPTKIPEGIVADPYRTRNSEKRTCTRACCSNPSRLERAYRRGVLPRRNRKKRGFEGVWREHFLRRPERSHRSRIKARTIVSRAVPPKTIKSRR